ncbi:hypothetical protein WR25_17302 isoform K [Diploscapter pachys]|nr:hypothetical protein WR25_17302 isoform C [Diploscapter pachys]PAV88773.1 hypothetical protein WR25_17302 isoform D [Diploscapter pachys]PAV88775.1 hypothetical protein WR25_17302 isoform F [Diploscapter pachys]PAV88777.1 hypothetical protein WR25_17302 isoform H [Diploscapter pachys]PAV88779.1 hypothetical protein WR25_17302 isoform J [Diploscapter pachys]
MSKKIALIQNPGLGEFKIRDMNDDINRLVRLKNAWEHRIKTIGGPDYRRIAPKQLDREGREVSSNKGYKYFGAAKDLPGVRELFKKSDEAEVLRKARAELMKHVDAGYYGYIDEDNRKMIEAEQEQEKVAVAEAERVIFLFLFHYSQINSSKFFFQIYKKFCFLFSNILSFFSNYPSKNKEMGE